MCDYSLHTFPNRLAVEDEQLVVHRFGGASLGLASVGDLAPVIPISQNEPNGLWSKIKTWFQAQRPKWEAPTRVPAVCVPPGARLILQDIPKRLQRELCVGEVETVTFTEISAEVNTYRDAIRFDNNRRILLQALEPGQRVTVVSLTPDEIEVRTSLDPVIAN
jgi:hypothetical protein